MPVEIKRRVKVVIGGLGAFKKYDVFLPAEDVDKLEEMLGGPTEWVEKPWLTELDPSNGDTYIACVPYGEYQAAINRMAVRGYYVHRWEPSPKSPPDDKRPGPYILVEFRPVQGE